MIEPTRREKLYRIKTLIEIWHKGYETADSIFPQIEALFVVPQTPDQSADYLQAKKGLCECPEPYLGAQPIGHWPVCERCGRNVRLQLQSFTERRKGQRRIASHLLYSLGVEENKRLATEDRREVDQWKQMAKELARLLRGQMTPNFGYKECTEALAKFSEMEKESH